MIKIRSLLIFLIGIAVQGCEKQEDSDQWALLSSVDTWIDHLPPDERSPALLAALNDEKKRNLLILTFIDYRNEYVKSANKEQILFVLNKVNDLDRDSLLSIASVAGGNVDPSLRLQAINVLYGHSGKPSFRELSGLIVRILENTMQNEQDSHVRERKQAFIAKVGGA